MAGLAERADAIRVVKGAWPYHDPGRIVAERLGASPRQTALSTDGGNTPQSLVNRSCLEIQAGRLDVVVLVGGEGIWSRRRARRAGKTIPYTDDSASPAAEVLGHELKMSSRLEMERGFEAPINIYPTFENAIRAQRGESIPEHRTRISELWERFNRVAVDNPYAWVRRPMTAEQIRTPSADNRMVGFPYTKAMNSNWDLDQAAALILCSAARSRGRRRRPRPLGLPVGGDRRPRHDAVLRARQLLVLPGHPHRRAGRVRAGRARPSTTSPTSTSTPASPPRCRSPPPSSACPRTARSR